MHDHLHIFFHFFATNQKLKITKKLSDLTKKVNEVEYKLNNKSFLKNAPKNIVEKEKKSLIDNKIELKKLNSIVNSIKNWNFHCSIVSN